MVSNFCSNFCLLWNSKTYFFLYFHVKATGMQAIWQFGPPRWLISGRLEQHSDWLGWPCQFGWWCQWLCWLAKQAFGLSHSLALVALLILVFGGHHWCGCLWSWHGGLWGPRWFGTDRWWHWSRGQSWWPGTARASRCRIVVQTVI